MRFLVCRVSQLSWIETFRAQSDYGLRNEDEKALDADWIKLFCYLSDKDAFEHYYKNQLARRLLQGKLKSDEAEKQVIGSLKTECGQHYTRKLEGMLNDISVSKFSHAEFRVGLRTVNCDSFSHGLVQGG